MSEFLEQYKLHPVHMHVWIALTIVCLLLTPAASADDYLDSLKEEAEQLPYLESNEHLQPPAQTAGNKQGAQLKQRFEALLNKRSPATALIYKRLKSENKQRVINIYGITEDFDKTEKSIHEIHLQQQQ